MRTFAALIEISPYQSNPSEINQTEKDRMISLVCGT